MPIPLKEIDFIGQYRVSHTVCDELIELFKKISDSEGREVPISKGPGKIGATSPVINLDVKDSTDVSFISECIYKPHLFGEEFNEYLKTLHDYFIELSKCLSLYIKDHHFTEELSSNVLMFGELKIVEGTNIQHYKPGGGYKEWHFERGSNVPPMCLRQLVFMTYLNDVPEGGTEFYFQNKKFEAQKGKTLIWPSDFTHTHRGVISNTHEKYIITGWFGHDPKSL